MGRGRWYRGGGGGCKRRGYGPVRGIRVGLGDEGTGGGPMDVRTAPCGNVPRRALDHGGEDMGLFGPSVKTYNRASFYEMAQKLNEYRMLEGIVGRLSATYVLGMIFEEQYKNNSKGGVVGPGSEFTIKGANANAFGGQIGDILGFEAKRIKGKQ